MNKEAWRQKLRHELQLLDRSSFEIAKTRLQENIISFFQKNSHLIQLQGASYFPMKYELGPDNKQLEYWLKSPLAYPVLSEGDMIFGLGNEEPNKIWLSEAEKILTPDWLLVPGLGFSLQGGRLGQGKGFYDKYLSSGQKVKIGICLEKCIFENIPLEKHDVLMDFIITEKYCWDVSQQVRF